MSSVNQFKDTIIYGNFKNKDNYKSGGNIASATFDRSINVGLTGYFSSGLGITGNALFNNDITVSGQLSVGATGIFNSSLKLPNNQVINTTTPSLLTSSSSISNSQLSSNVCLLDASPSFTSSPKFYNGYNVYGGNVGAFLDSTNTNSTQISQYNSDCYIINYTSGGTIFINSTTVNLSSSNVILKGGTNINNYTTALPYSDGVNYITGTTNLRLGDVNITDGLLTCNALTLSLNSNFTQSGSGKITQASSSSKNTLNPTQFLGDITFATGVYRINNVNTAPNILPTISCSNQITLPNSQIINTTSPNLVDLSSSQTLTNKTLTDGIANTQLSTDNSTKIATTAYVKSLNYLTAVPSTYALLNSPTFTGTPSAPTAVSTTNTTQIATTAFVKAQNYLTAVPATYALLNSPTFTGTPSAPTPLSTDNTTQIATTAFVKAQNYLTAVPATYALLNSPTFTGTPLAPTAVSTTNTTQIATTAFVKAQGYLTSSSSIADSQLTTNVCLLNGTQTLINKTLTDPILTRTNGANTYTITIPNTGNDTIALLSNLSNYLTISSASSTYQTIAGLSSYLTSSSSISDSQLSANIPKINANNIYTGTNQYNSDLTVYTSGSNYLKLSDGTSTTRQYQSSGDYVLANQKTYSGGFGDIILSTTDTAGTGVERVRISYNRLKTNVNIELPSTYTAPTSGQLGYIQQGTILNVNLSTPVTMTSGTTYYLASMTLPVGVWNVFAQYAYVFTTGGNLTYENLSISTSATTISLDNCLAVNNINGITGNNRLQRINGIFSSTGSTALYPTLQLGYSTGPIPQYTGTTQTYVRFYAVRIG
jgi:hypothetical protein